MSEETAVGAAELRTLAVKLQDLLKIRTLPIGMKQYESLEENGDGAGPAPAEARTLPYHLPAG